jgi:hypothetical protein
MKQSIMYPIMAVPFGIGTDCCCRFVAAWTIMHLEASSTLAVAYQPSQSQNKIRKAFSG